MLKSPTISIVIPNLNCAEFLERTILSVIEQNYPKLELIMVDGGSTDGSLEIIERYKSYFAHITSGPDTGQANAINKGFAVSSGDIMGWINSDDLLTRNCLATVGRVFGSRPDISWLLGNSTVIDVKGKMQRSTPPDAHTRARFLAGDYQWLQQESCYWRRPLWERAGSRLDESYKLAVDGELWLRFFRFERLHLIRAKLGAFRIRPGQRSADIDAYHAEMLRAIGEERDALSEENRDRYSAILASPLKHRSRSEAEQLSDAVTVEDRPALRVGLYRQFEDAFSSLLPPPRITR